MTEPLPLPPLPEPAGPREAALDYAMACHIAGRDGDGMPRQGSHAIKHACEEYARAYGLACRNAALEEAAKVADGRYWSTALADAVGPAVAAAIRALKGKTSQDSLWNGGK